MLSRVTAPNSLSIWVHNLQGISIHNAFKPEGCKHSINTAAITFAAGAQMAELNAAANSKGLSILSGGQHGVGYGGFATGAGHSALGPTYGVGADHVLEMEVVSPGGDLLTINECQNQELFWAMRGVSSPSDDGGFISADTT
jgi:FAD/FMN-containing dehydrogenase